MSIWKKLKGELIDVIEWIDNSQDTIVYKFPRHQNEIKNGARLTVRESQVAVFINEGKIADVYQPGMHTLITQNMPILTTLKGWKFGFNSPFMVDVYFVNTKRFTNQKWGTKNPFIVSDDRFGMIEVRAFGNYGFRITDAATFLREIAGTDKHFTTDEINGQLKSLIITAFSQSFGKAGIPIDFLVTRLDELGNLSKDKLNNQFSAYGIELTDFNIENASMPDELKKEIFNYSRLGRIDAQQLTQLNVANAIEKAATNQGLGGAGVGMGVGMGFGQIMGNAMQQAANQNHQTANQITPPPLLATVFVAINGQQQGPFAMQQLEQLAQNNQLNRETLVWKQGMPAWAPASTLVELQHIWQNVPPSVPPPLP